MKTRLTNLVLLLLITISANVFATTVIDFSLRDQVALSHDCVRVQVMSLDLSTPGVASYGLLVKESIYGTMTGEFQLDLASNINGNPKFEIDSEYVLFLNLNNQFEKVIGLSWGSFSIDKSNENISDGQGRVIELKSKPGVSQDFAYGRQESAKVRSQLAYSEFRGSIRNVREEHILHGGKQPNALVK